MKSALKPALDNLDRALLGLETALEERLSQPEQPPQPQLELARDDTAISRKIAAKLDMTINRLEAILSEE